jgi:hypothetical protein
MEFIEFILKIFTQEIYCILHTGQIILKDWYVRFRYTEFPGEYNVVFPYPAGKKKKKNLKLLTSVYHVGLSQEFYK